VKRLGLIDKVLIFTLVPIWAFWFGLYLNNLARGRVAEIPINVSVPQDPNSYPILLGFWYGVPRSGPWEGLKVGDRLLQVGQADLRGVWPIGFPARVYEATDASLHLPLVFMRNGRRYETVVSPISHPYPWVAAIINISFVGFAILLILRRPNSRLIRAVFIMTMVVSLRFIPFGLGPRAASQMLTYLMAFFSLASGLITLPLVLRVTYLFPEEKTAATLHLPKWPWLFAIAGPIWCSWMVGLQLPVLVYLCLDLAFLVTYLGRGTYGYLHADPIARRKVKWVLLGLYLTLVPIFASEVLAVVKPSLGPLFDLTLILYAFIPVFSYISIVRFNLFDIDRLISATTAYTLVSIIAIAAAIILLPLITQAASVVGGVDPTLGHFLTALLFAGLIVPSSRYIRPQVERLFFTERFAFERGVEHLVRALSDCQSAQEVLALVGERLYLYLRPESCVVYGHSGDIYAPLLILGPTVAPTIKAKSALVSALRSETGALEVERWLGRLNSSLPPSDQAILDSLSAAVLVPIHRGDIDAALLTLGHKRSGDIYTSTDFALLTAVADRASAELRRFAQAEIASEIRAMSDALRRYVPEPIAAQIIGGQNLDARESDVSVLFVDIRGYTTYAEDTPAAEVFSAISRFTSTVSRIVRAHGGTVVEFNGDGMMAVLGAPTTVAEKERAAVVAAREIVRSVHSLALGRHDEPLRVGIGIATGNAFVGNIQSIDRLIWSAVGDTPNLAARLQTLTRDLNAAIVIDLSTRMKAGNVADDFKLHSAVTIRGRRKIEDVYALPLAMVDPQLN
jgi:class 3 adenylate cyclase